MKLQLNLIMVLSVIFSDIVIKWFWHGCELHLKSVVVIKNIMNFLHVSAKRGILLISINRQWK